MRSPVGMLSDPPIPLTAILSCVSFALGIKFRLPYQDLQSRGNLVPTCLSDFSPCFHPSTTGPSRSLSEIPIIFLHQIPLHAVLFVAVLFPNLQLQTSSERSLPFFTSSCHSQLKHYIYHAFQVILWRIKI